MSRAVSHHLPQAAVPRLTAIAAALAAALLAAPAWSAPPVYQVVKLPGLVKPEAGAVQTSEATNAHGINANGDVAGYSTRYVFFKHKGYQISTGVIWPADGSAPITLKAPKPQRPNDNVIPWGINNARSVVGASIDYHGLNALPELWIGRQAPLALSSPDHGQALGINDANVAVGYVQTTDRDPAYPMVWTADGTPTQISTTPGHAARINATGWILGNLYPGDSIAPYVRDPAGNFRFLPDLPGQTPAYGRYAWDFNSRHEAVGSCDLAGANRQNMVACLWEADGSVRDLGRLPDSPEFEPSSYVAWSINSNRQVIGYYSHVAQPNNVSGFFPIYWSDETGLIDLRTLIDPDDPLRGELYDGYFVTTTINDDGVIVGQIHGNQAVKLVPKAQGAAAKAAARR